MNSIALFAEKGIENIYKAINKFLEDPTDFAGFTTGLREETSKFEQGVIRDTLELMDEKLRESPERKEKYEIVKRDRRTVVTSLGEVTFKRTYFKDRESKEKTYLVDEITRLDHRERLTEDAKVRMLTEVTEGSYRKSGEATCLNGDRISRQTVKNEIHQLEFPEMEKPEEKRQATTLYIDADEDHVSLQYLEKKGDVQRTEGKYKNNGMLNKIVYVYEGIEREGPKSKRRKLIRPYYICGSYSGEENRKLWEEVAEYIESHYDEKSLKKVFLNADGGSWIEAGKDTIRKVVPVLDEFHLSKYLVSMTHFLGESAEDARRELKDAIRSDDIEAFIKECGKILSYTDDPAVMKRIEKGRVYIQTNWNAAVLRLTARDIVYGCSAEGHVSHVLSARMSSRPMGWSRTGADKMAKLLAYRKNGRDILELVRYQDRDLEFPKAAGAEEMIRTSAEEILRSERHCYRKGGKYYDSIQATLSYQNRKQAAISMGIWI